MVGLIQIFILNETIRFVDTNSKDFIEFSHEYKGDDVNKEIKWKDEITISGNTIKRNIIKYNFADYPVLKSCSKLSL